jgi:hypothetical protein
MRRYSWSAFLIPLAAAAASSPVYVNPASGSAFSQTFEFAFVDPTGAQDFHLIDVLINNFLDGRHACFVAFVPPASVYLVDDAGDAGGPFQGLVLPAGGTIQNSQCSISGSGSSVTMAGNLLKLTLAITFSAAFAGNKVVYLAAQDSSSNSGWQALGTYNVPGSVNSGPAVSGMNPGRTVSSPQAYTFTFTDTNGTGDLAVLNVLVNNFIDGRVGCYIAFVPPGTLYLVDDAGDAGGPYTSTTIPGSGSVSNHQCTISGQGSSVSSAGNTITLTLAITFSQGFSGNRVFYLAARSNTANSDWQAVGSTTVGTYDQLTLRDTPVAFWNMSAQSGTEADLTGNGNAGTYKGGMPATGTMPNGDTAAVFNGSTEYLTVPSAAAFSIPTTGSLTWEMWIQPTTLQFPNSSSDGYVEVMGKCAHYSPTCEWQSRFYNATNPQGRCDRLSAYAYNLTAGLGSGADWQPVCGLLQAGQWIHVVGEYTTRSQPADCPNAPSFPGLIDIWVNGVKWDQAVHNPTGCMSQYNVTPQASSSPLNIGSMSQATWFAGAIGKVAIYNYELTQAQITAHYQAMTARMPSGSCGDTCTF